MKLATLRTKNRDGQLCLVDKELTKAVLVGDIAPTLQFALDQWPIIEPLLRERSFALNNGEIKQTLAFSEQDWCSPLPRAYQWADGSAYVNHVELVRKARGAEMPHRFWEEPLMYQGGSDSFLGPNEPIGVQHESFGIDFEAEVAIITNDVPMGIHVNETHQHILLLMLVNDVSLRNLIPDELAKGFGFFQSKPASSFSPIAVTLDEVGDVWQDGKIHLPLQSYLNGVLFGEPNAGVDMTFSFYQLLAHAARTRKLSAGTIIGSGTVSNLDRSKGSSCIAEKRMLEIIATGKPQTPFMKYGDTIRIEMKDPKGQSIFGAIDQKVVPYEQ